MNLLLKFLYTLVLLAVASSQADAQIARLLLKEAIQYEKEKLRDEAKERVIKYLVDEPKLDRLIELALGCNISQPAACVLQAMIKCEPLGDPDAVAVEMHRHSAACREYFPKMMTVYKDLTLAIEKKEKEPQRGQETSLFLTKRRLQDAEKQLGEEIRALEVHLNETVKSKEDTDARLRSDLKSIRQAREA